MALCAEAKASFIRAGMNDDSFYLFRTSSFSSLFPFKPHTLHCFRHTAPRSSPPRDLISSLTGQDHTDFGYNVIKDVLIVQRFIREWGDVVITLKEGIKVDLNSVSKFRENVKYYLVMTQKPLIFDETGPKDF
ncbi:hypothetical protein HKD37_20G057696 [Glycine soja]